MAGTFQLSREDEAYTLVADQAVLSDILQEIDRQEPAALRFFGTYDQAVSATYRDVSLDTLLYRLGVSYVLTFEADGDGNYRLGDAMMLDSDGMGVDSATAAMIRNHIRNLRHDDVPNNAHHAYRALMDLGCESTPFLEVALYDADFQCRHAAAQLLRMRFNCPDRPVSDRLIEVTFEALDQDHDEHKLAEFIWLGGGYQMLLDTGVYTRVRSRVLNNLTSTEGRVRLYSSLLAGNQGEPTYIPQLVRIMAPHLADNDLHGDAAVCAHAIHQLGPAALPYLQPYRNSTDKQQAELAELICTALETGDTPRFNPTMYYGYSKNPVTDDPWPSVTSWSNDQFPDANGQYHNLKQPRQTAAEIYGTSPANDFVCALPLDVEYLELYGTNATNSTTAPPLKDGYYYNAVPIEYTQTNPDYPFPYRVKDGDTFESICVKFSAKPEIVEYLNTLMPADRILEPGMFILIPW